ncbi:MAG: ATP-binding protein [Congregibacter sp.]|nr:ATP-binding protein [Congregibacter sp.]
MNLFYLAIPSLAMLITLGLLYRQSREYRQTFENLPTGLCVVASDHRIQRWNRQMATLSGIPAENAVAKKVADLPSPWPEALSEVLADPQGSVIKQALGYDVTGGERWVILHSSQLQLPGRKRQVLVEDITDYQRLQDEVLHNERLASIGRLAAGVAHEIGNPVTGIACIAQNLADGADVMELELGTAEILKQTDRISRTVSSLMQLSHPGSVARDADCVPCNIADCIDEAAHLLSLDMDVAPGKFTNMTNRELLVRADSQLLLQVFLNLLDNARSAAADEGPILINAQQDGDTTTITIDNPGPAIAPSVLSKVFEPFYTTKDVVEGTGLGLALVRRMLEAMGGSIGLLSPSPNSPGKGVRARVILRSADYGHILESVR